MTVMLADSARIHEEEAQSAAIVGRPAAVLRSSFTRTDAQLTVQQCEVVPYDEPRDISSTVQLRFTDAGHILGSAMVNLTLDHAGQTSRITFTGDVGRRGLPFLSEPAAVPASDLLICESTYGGRLHETVGAWPRS
jgi:metallo-beta-lactamase family protein